MAQVLKLRRGTRLQHTTFVGEVGEVTVDTTAESIRVHDGLTAGGHLVATDIVSVKDFGAVGDGVADDTAAIQAAIDSLSTSFGVVKLPAGSYKITSTLNLHSNVSLLGDSTGTSIYAISCNAITIGLTIGYVRSPWYIQDLQLIGNNGNYTGILAAGTLTLSDRTNALQINRNSFLSFSIGIALRTCWEFTIENNYMTNIDVGIQLSGQCVQTTIQKNHFVVNVAPGFNTKNGVSSISSTYNPAATIRRPEDVNISNNYIYGFTNGVLLSSAYYAVVSANDIDACSGTGVTIQAVSGTTSVIDNFISLITSSATNGVNIAGVATLDTSASINIEGNCIVSDGMQAGSKGVFVGLYHDNTNIKSNHISGFTAYDIHANAAYSVSIHDNCCQSVVTKSVFIDSSVGGLVTISGNAHSGLLALHPSNNLCRVVFGANSSPVQTTMLQGLVTIPNGATSATINFSALLNSPPAMIGLTDAGLLHSFNFGSPTTNIGTVWSTTSFSNNITAVNITCATASVGSTIVPYTFQSIPAKY